MIIDFIFMLNKVFFLDRNGFAKVKIDMADIFNDNDFHYRIGGLDMEIKILTLIVTVVACLAALSRSQTLWFDKLTLVCTHIFTIASASLSFLIFILEAEPLYILSTTILLIGLTVSYRFGHYLMEIITLPFAFFISIVAVLTPIKLVSISWTNALVAGILVLAGPSFISRIDRSPPKNIEKLLWGQNWSPKTFPLRMALFQALLAKYRQIPMNLIRN